MIKLIIRKPLIKITSLRGYFNLSVDLICGDYKLDIELVDIKQESDDGISLKETSKRTGTANKLNKVGSKRESPNGKKRRSKGEQSVKVKVKKETRRKAHPPPVELDEPIECDTCNSTYKNNVAFALHTIKHADDNKYSCHLCPYKNISKYHIEMHVRAHEGTTKYKCEVCQKAFTVSTHAIEHKYFHTGEKPFQCEICGKHFMFSRFLAAHRRSQHYEILTGSPLVKFDCKTCNKHYASASGLRRHKLSKHNDAGIDLSVLCDICGKRLSSKEKLKFHRRIHTGYKPFVCQVCGKAFTKKDQLIEHVRVHTGEKPHICKYCGRGFTQRTPLKIHERTHSGEKPYVCPSCGKGFVTKTSVDSHMKNCSNNVVTAFNPSWIGHPFQQIAQPPKYFSL
ncbi:hypothetical protein GWI33_008329 [Rhynchophorus ferrugineus]|uniref:C2H2-type domain-containing protein n=1 Tax=Rhynchophorus ferrugineus TaxID=354439 RepID=A0A834IU08_RHYFE|nr:hypothetical protein GWI33_008329 [Rhynchophorus ferrugineus]